MILNLVASRERELGLTHVVHTHTCTKSTSKHGIKYMYNKLILVCLTCYLVMFCTVRLNSFTFYHFAPGCWSGVNGKFHSIGAPSVGGNPALAFTSINEDPFSHTKVGQCVCL